MSDRFFRLDAHSGVAQEFVRIRAGFFASSSTGILEALEGLGKGKEDGRGDGVLALLDGEVQDHRVCVSMI